jgi:hypothetical protein
MKKSVLAALLLPAAYASAQVAPPPTPAGPPTIPTNVSSIKAVPALPEGFDAVNASPQMLQSVGLPPKPDQTKDPKAYNSWKTMVKHAKRHVTASVTEQPNIVHKPAQLVKALSETPAAAKNPTIAESYNWSGPTIYDANKPFATSYIVGYWMIPFAQQTFGAPDGTWDYSSQWVGIDGWGSGDVMQAGTEVDAYANGSAAYQFYSFWIEWYPFAESRVSNFPVGAGDTVMVEVWNTSPTNGYAFLENLSTDRYTEFNLTAPSGTSLQGTSAEWIVERPSVGGSLARLTNYVGDAFAFAYAGGYDYQVVYYPGADYVPTGTVYSVYMLDNSSKLISYSELNSPTDIWFFDTGSAY